MNEAFKGFDFDGFWDNSSEYVQRAYIFDAFSDELLLEIEERLGFKLPKDYVEFMRHQNGGSPFKTCFPTEVPTSWAEDHIAIECIFAIHKEKDYSLCGALGSQFMIDEWGYPADCVYFASCPSAGHDMVAFDYSECGKDGEPCVVHIDQESDYKKTFLAKDFATFIKGLKNESEFDLYR